MVTMTENDSFIATDNDSRHIDKIHAAKQI